MAFRCGELDGDVGVAYRNALVDRLAGGVDLQQHVAFDRRTAGEDCVHRDAHRTGDAVRTEDEAALPVDQLRAEDLHAHIRGADPYRLRCRRRVAGVGIGQRDLLESEVAAHDKRSGDRGIGEGYREGQRARQPQEPPLAHDKLQRFARAVLDEGFVDGGVHRLDLDGESAADRDVRAAAANDQWRAGELVVLDARRHALLGYQEIPFQAA